MDGEQHILRNIKLEALPVTFQEKGSNGLRFSYQYTL